MSIIPSVGAWSPDATIFGSLWTARSALSDLIASLFKSGEQGFAYDINDLSTLFQDAAGTIPVTGAGQPVGLVLDKSKGLVVGSNIANPATVIGSGIGGAAFKTTTVATGTSGKWYKVSLTVSNYSGFGLVGFTDASFPDMPTSANKSISGNGIISFIARAGTTIIVYTRDTNNADFSNISIKELPGNHAYQTNAASRPLLQRNATTGAYYLAFDGTDDFLVTSSIDFTAADKISLFAGVVKFATSVRILCELSADMNTNAGSFYLTAPETADGRYSFKSRGSALSNPAMTALSSTTNANDAAVISASGNISGDTNKIRRNAVATSSTYELGTGNYGNYPLYIGRRGGTTLPFNGHLYSLIGVARLSTDAETTALEKAIAKNVGVTI